MIENPLVSVIIPVYNAEKYLNCCIDSIINQTYRNLEILLIDDGSTDNSLKICGEYAAVYDRVTVLDKENEGTSATRNFGLNAAKGQYVMFVDSDDWIEPITCESAVNAMRENDADIVMWSYISEGKQSSSKKHIFNNDIIFSCDEVKEKLHRRLFGLIGNELKFPELADSICPVWGKLYKRELIKDISFVDLSEIGSYEDGLFNIDAFALVNKAVYLNKCFYHYRRENSSSVTSFYRKDLFENYQHLFDLMQNNINDNNLSSDYTEALNNRIALSILGIGLNILVSRGRVGEKIKKIKEIISSERHKTAYANLVFKYFPLHWKLFFACAKYGCAYGVYILLVIIQKILSR